MTKTMERDQVDELIQFALRLDHEIQAAKHQIYSTENEFDEDQVIGKFIEIQKLMESLNDMVRSLDEETDEVQGKAAAS